MFLVVGVSRAVIGLTQGAILFMLYRTAVAKGWLAAEPMLFSPLVVNAIFVPLIAIVGLSNLRPVTLAIWVAAAMALCSGFSVYDIYREGSTTALQARAIMLPQAWIALGAVLFILHSLIVAGDAERRFVASYPAYFETASKLAVQAALAGGFTGAFWALLKLGAELFRLIHLESLNDLIGHDWFWMPITTLVAACALHVTDVRAGLVRGLRMLGLTLLSWLLPMMALFAAAFVLALPFTGLEPLWSTRSATFILLGAAGAIVVLINAAYQDGEPDTPIAGILRYARFVAAFVIVPLVALAGYALMLRVQQYGWTPQRITVFACVVVLACCAAGYAIAAVLSGPKLRGLQTTNICTAYVVLFVLLALFSPIADPARISVADQVARLRSGQTPVEKMDFQFLRFDGGRFGQDALRQLAVETDGSVQTVAIAQRARQAQAMQYRRYDAQLPPAAFKATARTRAANITVVQPAGQTLPENFLEQEWSVPLTQSYVVPHCLTADSKCEAILADIDGDGRPDILLFNSSGGPGTAFKADDDKSWTMLGQVVNSHCKGVRDALRAGQFKLVSNPLKDIEAAGQRLRIGLICLQ